MLKVIGQDENSHCRVSESEVTMSALYFGGRLGNGRGFIKKTGLMPKMPGKTGLTGG